MLENRKKVKKPKAGNKKSYSSSVTAPHPKDFCFTPPEAVTILLEPLDKLTRLHENLTGEKPIIWESACGKGYLSEALVRFGFEVCSTDLYPKYDYADEYNFFSTEPAPKHDIQITNPPFGTKYQWLQRSIEIGKPFALLLPIEVIGTKKFFSLTKQAHMQFIVPNGRINFEMPYKGFEGSAPFATMWVTYKFDLPFDVVYEDCYTKARVNSVSEARSYLGL